MHVELLFAFQLVLVLLQSYKQGRSPQHCKQSCWNLGLLSQVWENSTLLVTRLHIAWDLRSKILGMCTLAHACRPSEHVAKPLARAAQFVTMPVVNQLSWLALSQHTDTSRNLLWHDTGSTNELSSFVCQSGLLAVRLTCLGLAVRSRVLHAKWPCLLTQVQWPVVELEHDPTRSVGPNLVLG